MATTSNSIRIFALGFAFVLACQAAWILTAETARPFGLNFSSDPNTAREIARSRNAARHAASFGFLRGDLWADYSLTYLNLCLSDTEGTGQQNHDSIERAQKAARRALSLAPYDARVWLVLACVNSLSKEQSQTQVLQMAYFTGANEIELIPLRLRLAVSNNAIAERDFQQLVGHDIRIVSRKPKLAPSVLAAYGKALPIGREFIDKTLQDVDPALFGTLHPRD